MMSPEMREAVIRSMRSHLTVHVSNYGLSAEIEGIEDAADAILSLLATLGAGEGGSVGEPVAWRVKDFADGWIYYRLHEQAVRQAESTGALIQGLYPGPARPEQGRGGGG